MPVNILQSTLFPTHPTILSKQFAPLPTHSAKQLDEHVKLSQLVCSEGFSMENENCIGKFCPKLYLKFENWTLPHYIRQTPMNASWCQMTATRIRRAWILVVRICVFQRLVLTTTNATKLAASVCNFAYTKRTKHVVTKVLLPPKLLATRFFRYDRSRIPSLFWNWSITISIGLQ